MVEIKRDVCGLIRLHGDAKQLSEMKFQIIQAKKMFFYLDFLELDWLKSVQMHTIQP